jgi:hypothetical protein
MEGGLVVGGADESMKGRDDEVVPGETGRRRGGASGGAGALTEAETRVPTATRLTIYDSRPTTHDPQLTIHHPASEASGPSSTLHPPSILFCLRDDLPSVGTESPSWRGRDRVGRGAMISTVAAVFGSRRDGGAPRSVNRRHRTPDSGRDGSSAVDDETLHRWSISRPDRPSPTHTSSPARWRCIPPGSGWR